MKSQLVWILSGVSLVAVGMVASVSACSSGGDTVDAGRDAAAADTGAKDSSSDQNTGADSGPQDAGADCKADPTLHPATAGQIFCGYGDAGSFSCATGQECCLGGKLGTGFAPEMCATFGASCTNGTKPVPIECTQPQDCMANGVTGACCLSGGGTPMQVAGCDSQDLKSTGGTAITCEASDAGTSDASATTASCAGNELQVCEAQSDCPSGKKCTPTRWKLYEIGVCL